MRILALDVGEKNIGLAVSDALGWTAQGLSNLRRRNPACDIAAIQQIVAANQVGEIIVGMPVNLDGSLGKQAREVAAFLDALKTKIDLPIKPWDERFSSLQAERLMLSADLSRSRRKKKIDRLAAQLILQNYLDANTQNRDVQKK